jgi:uncharacterized membrane protein
VEGNTQELLERLGRIESEVATLRDSVEELRLRIAEMQIPQTSFSYGVPSPSVSSEPPSTQPQSEPAVPPVPTLWPGPPPAPTPWPGPPPAPTPWPGPPPAPTPWPGPAYAPNSAPNQPLDAEVPFLDKRNRNLLELDIVGSWFARIGAIVVLIGAGFAFKYAIDIGLIGPLERVVIGVTFGLGLAGWGEWAYRRGWHRFAHALTGGGSALVYLSLLVGYRIYDLYTASIAFTLLTLSVSASFAAALARNVQPMAVIASVGGFLNPFLIGEGPAGPVSLLAYIAILNSAVLMAAYFRRWEWVEATAVTGTWSFVAAAISSAPPSHALAFIWIYFLMLTAAPFTRWAIREEGPSVLDGFLVSANAAACFLTSMSAVGWGNAPWRGLIPAAIAAVFVALTAIASLRMRQHREVAALFVPIAGAGAFLAIAVQLEARWVVMGWVCLGAALVASGVFLDQRFTSLAGATLAVFGAVVTAVVVYSLGIEYAPGRVLFSWDSLILGVEVLALVSAGTLMRRYSSGDRERVISGEHAPVIPKAQTFPANGLSGPQGLDPREERWDLASERGSREPHADWGPDIPVDVPVLLFLAAHGVALFWLSVEVALAIRTFGVGKSNRLYLYDLGFGAAWGVYAVSVIAFSQLRKSALTWTLGGAFIAAVAAKLLVVDLLYGVGQYRPDILLVSPESLLLLSTVATITLGSAMFSVPYSYRVPLAGTVRILLAVTACIGIVGWMSLEAVAAFARVAAGPLEQRRHDLQLVISLIWGLSGFAAISAGMAMRARWVRIFGIAVMAVTVLKLALVDVWLLTTAYRTIVFVALGVVLIVASFMYNRFKLLITEERSSASG